MVSRKVRRLTGCVSVVLLGSIAVLAQAQQATKSDSDVARQGALAFAAAHGEQPRYGGTFLSAGNEEIPSYDMHQTQGDRILIPCIDVEWRLESHLITGLW